MANIIRRSNALQQSVAEMLERGQRRHLQRNALLSSLYQNQSNLRHLADLNDRGGDKAIDPRRLAEMDRLNRGCDPYRHAAVDRPATRPAARRPADTQRRSPRWRLSSLM
ncbi:histidine kinase [Klebsiella pneumoniae]|uniref:Histidine kinase n=1 Tax=Klebsiella pneumoniae TaxID=573 RepID=A0A377Y7L7_KLEPN|nr:histidine kinase [Klebsiella pneumoniae]